MENLIAFIDRIADMIIYKARLDCIDMAGITRRQVQAVLLTSNALAGLTHVQAGQVLGILPSAVKTACAKARANKGLAKLLDFNTTPHTEFSFESLTGGQGDTEIDYVEVWPSCGNPTQEDIDDALDMGMTTEDIFGLEHIAGPAYNMS